VSAVVAQSLICSPVVDTVAEWDRWMARARTPEECGRAFTWIMHNWMAALSRATPEQLPAIVEEFVQFAALVRRDRA
jgi:hypothetical protein